MAATAEPDPDGLIEVFKALGNPARLQIMQWLKDPDTHFAAYEPIADRRSVGVCVMHIQAKSGLSQSTVSSYMSTLERAGLVHPTRVGKFTHYRRDEERLAQLAAAIGATLRPASD
ncbi:ArsR/SmtB family transcription factor [Streptomyces sp. NPDC056683]|uniref:ArsR/SmtB family transcription factor n=1 Tax=Streptomyces sp. NPDC056683 TaxID=3345910 RepID=UPI00368A6880